MNPGALLACLALGLGQAEPPLPRLELLVRDPLEVYTDADEIWLEVYLLADPMEMVEELLFCINYAPGISYVTDLDPSEEIGRAARCTFQARMDPCSLVPNMSDLRVTIATNPICEPFTVPHGRIHIGSARLYLHPPEGPATYAITAGGCPCRLQADGFLRYFSPQRFVAVTSAELLLPIEGHPFIRGDANRDRVVDVSDPVKTLDVLFDGGGEFECPNAADSNDDNRIDMSDAIYTLGFLFLGSALPPPPYPEAGYDDTSGTVEGGTYGCEWALP